MGLCGAGFSLAGEGFLGLGEDGAEFGGAVLDGGGVGHGEHVRECRLYGRYPGLRVWEKMIANSWPTGLWPPPLSCAGCWDALGLVFADPMSFVEVAMSCDSLRFSQIGVRVVRV